MVFKEQTTSDLPIYIPCQFPLQNTWLSGLYDPGSFATIMKHSIAKKLKLPIEPTEQRINGVGSTNNRCAGKAIVDMRIGHHGLWEKTVVFIVPDESLGIPLIVGRNPLHNRSVKISSNLEKRTLFIKNQNGWCRVPLISDPQHEDFDIRKDGCGTFTADSSTTDLINLVTELGIDINADAPDAQVRLMAQIMLKHKSVFSSEARPIGNFARFVARIDTT